MEHMEHYDRRLGDRVERLGGSHNTTRAQAAGHTDALAGNPCDRTSSVRAADGPFNSVQATSESPALHAPPPPIDIDKALFAEENSQRAVWSMRIGLLLTAVFELSYLLAYYPPGRIRLSYVLALHGLNLGVTLGALVLSRMQLFRRHWRIASLITATVLICNATGVSLATGDTDELGFVVLGLITGGGFLMPWDGWWQATLSSVGLISILATQLYYPQSRFPALVRWPILLAIVVAAQFVAFERVHYRRKLAERSARLMKERDELLQKIIEASPEVISVLSLSTGKYLYVSREVTLTGYSREEFIGKSPAELRIWADTNQFASLLSDLEAGKTIRNVEFTLRHRDGSLFPCLLSAATAERSGEPIVVMVAHNITEWKKAEQRLAESELKFREIFNLNPDAVSINSLEDGKYLEVNDGWVAEFGYTMAELAGRRPADLGIWADRNDLRAVVRALREQRRVINYEAEFNRKDGSRLAGLFSAVVARLGNADVLFSYVRNISERKEAERKLAESETRFRQVFDSSLDAIIIQDPRTGAIEDANNEFLRATGLTREEVIGKSAHELRLWASESEYARFSEILRAQGYVRNFEAQFRGKEGKTETRLINTATVEMGDRRRRVTVSHDITGLKEVERELIEAREAALAASRAKSEFLSSMSHEIRTPMNAIVGLGELLAESSLDAEQRRYVRGITSNADALLALINDILDLARIESGRLELEQNDFELDELLEQTTSGIALRAHQKGLELAVRIAPHVPLSLTGDSLRLRQILVNLLGNAVKFTLEGEIVLGVEREQGKLNGNAFENADTGNSDAAESERTALLHFTVQDTGIGIPQDKLETIFASFNQADSSTTRQYGGTGLGLAIVRRLTELYGGRVWVESKLGKGSTFHVVLPFRARAAAYQREPPKITGLAGCRVLVVDDTPVNRHIVSEILSGSTARIDEAESGEQALDMLERAELEGAPYGLMLLDCRMPGMDGFQVAERIKSRERKSDLVILMLTSDGLNAKFERAQELGIAACLVKPIKRAELLAAIADALCGQPKLKTLPSGVVSRPAMRNAPGALRILLAEDSPDNRLVITAYLANTSHQLEAVENGEQAVEKFTAAARAGCPYDLVLMDMQMPVMDGYTAVRLVRRWERDQGLAPTPILALTASAFAHDVRNCLEAGCSGHVAKPVRKHSLLEAIERACVPASLGSDGGVASAPAAEHSSTDKKPGTSQP
jgi:two-component system sensor histidine kinase/response regulator